MSKAHDDFMDAFDRLIDEVGAADATMVITAIFVSLIVSYAEHRGYDINKPIMVDGGDQRDITIHAPKNDKQEGGAA